MPSTVVSGTRPVDAVGEPGARTDASPRVREKGHPAPFDFRTPNKLSREHVRALQMVQEAFARQMGTVFAASLRTSTQVLVAGIDQQSWAEFGAAAPDPSYLAVCNLDPLPGLGILNLPLDLTTAVVDLLLGGSGHNRLPNRPPTEIESVLLRDLVDRLLHELSNSHGPLLTFAANFVRQESSLQFVQIAAPSDPVVVVSYDVKLADTESRATLCIPLTTLQPVLDAATRLAQADARGRASDGDAVRAAIGNRLLDATVEVSVCFREATITPSEILDLAPGDIVPLHHRETAPLTLLAAGMPFLAVRPGRRGKRPACLVVSPESEEH